MPGSVHVGPARLAVEKTGLDGPGPCLQQEWAAPQPVMLVKPHSRHTQGHLHEPVSPPPSYPQSGSPLRGVASYPQIDVQVYPVINSVYGMLSKAVAAAKERVAALAVFEKGEEVQNANNMSEAMSHFKAAKENCFFFFKQKTAYEI